MGSCEPATSCGRTETTWLAGDAGHRKAHVRWLRLGHRGRRNRRTHAVASDRRGHWLGVAGRIRAAARSSAGWPWTARNSPTTANGRAAAATRKALARRKLRSPSGMRGILAGAAGRSALPRQVCRTSVCPGADNANAAGLDQCAMPQGSGGPFIASGLRSSTILTERSPNPLRSNTCVPLTGPYVVRPHARFGFPSWPPWWPPSDYSVHGRSNPSAQARCRSVSGRP